MDGKSLQYEQKRWIHFGACTLNVILVVITVIVLSNTDDSPFSEFDHLIPERVVTYLIIFIGIESIGMFGAYCEQSSLATNYICMYVFKVVAIFIVLQGLWDTLGVVFFFFYLVSFVTSILFLVSLSGELQRRQLKLYSQYNASPNAFSDVLSVQSPFRPSPGQSFVQVLQDNYSAQPLPENPFVQLSQRLELKPLPLHHYHPILPLTNDPSPSQVINVSEMTATTSDPAEPTLPSNEEFKSDPS